MNARMMALAGIALSAGMPASAQNSPNPAMNTPDELAWTLFIQVNAAASSQGNNNALFETWASDGDTFNSNPQWPTSGTQLDLRPPVIPVQVPENARRGAASRFLPQVTPVPNPTGVSEETRRNRATFDFIVQNNLYKVSGLQAAFGKPISFPIDSIEVKANWAPVNQIPGYTGNPADAGKVYHVNTASDGKQYALIAMHLISKLVPNWTWATFEHQNNPARCDIIGCKDSFGAQQAFVPPNPQPGQGYGACAKTAALDALIANAKWDPAYANYCLKGSQTDFTDSTGLAVRLGNSITEAGFVDQASCMTCHGRAAFDANGRATSLAGFDVSPSVGVVRARIGPLNPEWFWITGNPATGFADPAPFSPMFQNIADLQQIAQSADFVWSIPFCAINDTINPPQTKSVNCGRK